MKRLPANFNSFALKLHFTNELDIQIHHPPNATLTSSVIKQTLTKVDKATR